MAGQLDKVLLFENERTRATRLPGRHGTYLLEEVQTAITQTLDGVYPKPCSSEDLEGAIERALSHVLPD